MNGGRFRARNGARRAVLGVLVAIALAVALVLAFRDSAHRDGSEAQRPRMPRIGFVSPTEPGRRDQAFVRALEELGYRSGENATIEMRFAEGRADRLPALIDELLRLDVNVLVVGATIGARAAKASGTTIPVVFAGSSDPVAGGVVASLAHPGGNMTGCSLAVGEAFAGKWLDLLKEAAPGLARAAVLWSASNPAARRFVDELENAARKIGVTLTVHQAGNESELDAALAAIRGERVQGLIVTPSPFAAAQRRRLVEFAASERLPDAYFAEEFAHSGGLIAYGPSFAGAYRCAASYVDRILKGAKPGELPVEQSAQYDLVVNLKRARALGLAIPQSTLLRAAEVIE